MPRSSMLGIAAAAFVSCGGPYDTGNDSVFATPGSTAPGPAAPQITMVAPADQHEFEFDDDEHEEDAFDVEVRVERANLAEPGKCAGSAPCGHLVLLIDGVACGNPNSSSAKPKFKGKFGRCVTVSGPHQLVVQLVDDKGNVLAATQPVTVTVNARHG